MSATIPLPVRADPRPHDLLARAWAVQPSIGTRPSALSSMLAALRRRLHVTLAAWRDWRQIRATRLALMNLDAATLRDIGIVRTEIDSLAAEAHGGVAATRARLLTRVGPIAQ